MFTLLCGALKGFTKAFKAFVKHFEAPQRSVKTKIWANFLSPCEIGTRRVKKLGSTCKILLDPWLITAMKKIEPSIKVNVDIPINQKKEESNNKS